MIDFDVSTTRAVANAGELADALAEPADGGIRLVGHASTQHRLPPPDGAVTLVATEAMNRITRLDAADLTCSVEPGVTLAQLDEALTEHRLCLPCVDSGTSIGGVFARGARSALAPGGHDARSLVLGFEGVLAGGLAFKAGARVVKSVAGFDLAKAFVGSRGRLFAVSQLHLKLRPIPERTASFVERLQDTTAALARFRRLRVQSPPLAALTLRREGGAWSVVGRIAGRAAVVERQLRELGVREAEPTAWRVTPANGSELVSGNVAPRALEPWLEAVPNGADLAVTGGLQFDVVTAPDESDALLATLTERGDTPAAITRGAPARRRLATPPHPGAQRIERALRRALDPEGMLR